MNRTSILAHRGLFFSKNDKNSKAALKRALDEGFGLETDLRDLNKKIVVSHDPPTESKSMADLNWLLSLLASRNDASRIALNIKSDGLSSAMKQLLVSSGLDTDNIFFFDMSIPDCLSYLAEELPIYCRISEYEPNPIFLPHTKGVWVDSFTGSFDQISQAKTLLGNGIRTTIVSPELHGRDHLCLWREISNSGLYNNPLFELCTDYPVEASCQFC